MEYVRIQKQKIIIAYIALSFLICIAAAYPAAGGGTAAAGEEVVKIAQIMSNQKAYLNKAVIVQGKIAMQCSSGCWFILKDSTGQIFVDLNPSNLTIPQKRGATVKVYGRVALRDGDTFIIGKKLIF